MKYPNGHAYYCYLDAEQAEYMERLVREANKKNGARGKDAASVGGVVSAIVRNWIKERSK